MKHLIARFTISLLLFPATLFAQKNFKPGQQFRDCPNCPEMVVIPGGSFLIGSPSDEPGRDSLSPEIPWEGPRKLVTIRSFAVGKFIITRGQWAAFVADTHRPTVGGCSWAMLPGDTGKPWYPNEKANWNNIGYPQDDNHPAVCLTWDDAQDYVQWLSKKAGHTYRLLSESEFEYAARAGSTTAFPWGKVATHEYANYGSDTCCSPVILGRDQWGFGSSPVGAFPPNAFGLHDMVGNVLQWVEDCFHPSYTDLPTDGSPNRKDEMLNFQGELSFMNGRSSCFYHILRGGDFNDPPRMSDPLLPLENSSTMEQQVLPFGWQDHFDTYEVFVYRKIN